MTQTVLPGLFGGTFRAPASKSQAHRLLICAALGREKTTLVCDTCSDDILATSDCLRAMGAEITQAGSVFTVVPIFAKPRNSGLCKLKCHESGSTLRFLLPVVGALGLTGDFLMEGRLPERPLHPFDDVLRAHGMTIQQEGTVLHVSGQLAPGAYELPGNISSQYLSGLLFALPLLGGESHLTITGPLQSAAYLTMTERTVTASGIALSKTERGFRIPGNQGYHLPDGLAVEGDWSGAAFFLCAGALSAQGIRAENLTPGSLQADKAVCALLSQFGADVIWENQALLVRKNCLRAIRIDAGPIPDLIPAVAAVAVFAEGETTIFNAARLRLKESDRLHTVAETINALGGQAQELEDSLIITGRPQLSGGAADSFGDHRIAMLAAILSAGCQSAVTISGAECTTKSYPNFWQTLESLKGAAI